MNFVIYLILIITFFRYIVFTLSLLPIRFFLTTKRNRELEKQNQEKENVFVEIQDLSLRIKIKHCLYRYIVGYIRFFLFRIGYIPSHTIRNFLYKVIFLVKMEKLSTIYFGSEIRASYNLSIGKGSIIGDKSILDARNGIEIGENVNISSNVHIWTEQHDHRDPYFECNSDTSFRVKINNRAWIGPNVTILHSVEIGEGAVVAAGSVVTKNIEPFSIVAGIPAKRIGERTHNLKYDFKGSPSPFY